MLACVLALGCPADPPGEDAEPTPIGTREEAAFLRAADWLRENPPPEAAHALEEMFLLCDIVSLLPDSVARGVALAQLRVGFERLAEEHSDPTELPLFGQAVFYCAQVQVQGGSPPHGNWDPLLKRARRRGFELAVVVPALVSLWPHFNEDQRGELRDTCRSWLDRESWLAERQLPDVSDLRAWYRLTHVLFAITANGKAPPVGILTAEEEEWLRGALGVAVGEFAERPSVRQGDILAEVLINLRAIARESDEAFARGLEYAMSLQRADGAFAPPAEVAAPEDLDGLRHQTSVSMLALALDMLDAPP